MRGWRSIKFVAGKNTSLPVQLGCEDESDDRGNVTMCFLGNLNVEPVLLSPVQIAPTVPWLPNELYYKSDSCTERSGYPGWTIDNLSYNSVPQVDYSTATSQYGLSLNITNLSNLEKLSCTIRVDDTALDRTHSDSWIDCSVPGSSSPQTNILSTRVMFNRDYNLLAINQTWKCGGGASSGPS